MSSREILRGGLENATRPAWPSSAATRSTTPSPSTASRSPASSQPDARARERRAAAGRRAGADQAARRRRRSRRRCEARRRGARAARRRRSRVDDGRSTPRPREAARARRRPRPDRRHGLRPARAPALARRARAASPPKSMPRPSRPSRASRRCSRDDGAVSGGSRRNREYADGFTRWAPDVPEWRRRLACDATTSGGLLASVPADRTAALPARCRRAPASGRSGSDRRTLNAMEWPGPVPQPVFKTGEAWQPHAG